MNYQKCMKNNTCKTCSDYMFCKSEKKRGGVMNLDKYIRIALTDLSKKYKITIIELTIAKNQKVSKIFKVSYELFNNKTEISTRKEFKNKRELVRWLMCLQ